MGSNTLTTWSDGRHARHGQQFNAAMQLVRNDIAGFTPGRILDGAFMLRHVDALLPAWSPEQCAAIMAGRNNDVALHLLKRFPVMVKTNSQLLRALVAATLVQVIQREASHEPAFGRYDSPWTFLVCTRRMAKAFPFEEGPHTHVWSENIVDLWVSQNGTVLACYYDSEAGAVISTGATLDEVTSNVHILQGRRLARKRGLMP